MITFDMAAYLLSFFCFFFLIYNIIILKNKQTRENNKENNNKELEFYLKNQQILPHAKFKEPFLNLLHLLWRQYCRRSKELT